MREQRLAACFIEAEKEVPQAFRLIGQIAVPGFVPLGDLLGPGRLGKTVDLAEAAALQADFQARVRREAIEDLQDEGMECGDDGDVDVAGERVAQRQRPLRGQVEDEPIGQWLDAIVLAVVAGSAVHRLAVDDDTIAIVVATGSGSRARPSSPLIESPVSVRGSSSERTKPASTWSLPFAASVTNTPAMAFWAGS